MSRYFQYRRSELCADEVPLSDIAERWGTPCYVYSRQALERRYDAFRSAFEPRGGLVCYAVKANPSLAILEVLARAGAGFDIVSGGELARVLRAGGRPDRIVFSGACKLEDEIRAALQAEIRCINVESRSELVHIDRIAAGTGKKAPVALRVNPDVDAGTHPHIATGLDEHKFGVSLSRACALYQQAAHLDNVEPIGLGCHIGSQIMDLDPLVGAARSLARLGARLMTQGIRLQHVDIGGGLGVSRPGQSAPSAADYADSVIPPLEALGLEIFCEPGRAVVAPAGLLLTRVTYLKHRSRKSFALVDAAMNDLIRPALYGAWHEILPVRRDREVPKRRFDIVGPVCETADFLGRERDLALDEGDLLAVMDAGAYGFSMSSNYNSRPRCAEVIVDGGRQTLVRARETMEDLMSGEILLGRD